MKRKLVLGLLCAAVLSAAVVAGGASYIRHRVSAARLRTAGALLVDRVMLSVHFQAMAIEDAERDRGFLECVKSLDEGLKNQRYGIRFISPDKSIEKEQPKSEFEQQMLEWFAKRKPEETGKQDGPEYLEGPVTENNEYQYFQAIRGKKGCLTTCHMPSVTGMTGGPEAAPFGRGAPGGQKWNEGDLMAVVEITIPLPLDEP